MTNYYAPGESGNPNGRPKGSTDRRSKWREMLEREGDSIIEKIIQAALEDKTDRSALKFCAEKLITKITKPSMISIITPETKEKLKEIGKKPFNEQPREILPLVAAEELHEDLAERWLDLLYKCIEIENAPAIQELEDYLKKLGARD